MNIKTGYLEIEPGSYLDQCYSQSNWMRKTEDGEWEVSVKPTTHTYITPEDIRDMPLKDYAEFRKGLENSLDIPAFITPPEPKQYPAKQLTKRELYEDSYWKFVNSANYEDATYWKNQMEAQVTMELEPLPDYSSWCKDPEDTKNVELSVNKKKPKKLIYWITQICVIALCCYLAWFLEIK